MLENDLQIAQRAKTNQLMTRGPRRLQKCKPKNGRYILQEATLMQKEIKDNLTKEQGKSAGLQMLTEDIRSTPTYASVTRSSEQVQRTTCNTPNGHVLFVQSNNKEKSSKEIKDELTNKV
jgi:hypothetical protein